MRVHPRVASFASRNAIFGMSVVRDRINGALNARKERRHKEVIGHLIHTYGIGVGAESHPPRMAIVQFSN